jgi:hypothetical protein
VSSQRSCLSEGEAAKGFPERVGVREVKLTRDRRGARRSTGESVLLAEKDEIIKAVMAEGEELSKKQAVQEGVIKKLRAKLKEAEVEAQRLTSRLQVEEARVLCIQQVGGSLFLRLVTVSPRSTHATRLREVVDVLSVRPGRCTAVLTFATRTPQSGPPS